MTKVTANLRRGREAAGKRPTRVPKKLSSSPTPDATKKRRQSSKARKRSNQPSAHRMTTRSRAKSFQFMNLPPELRNLIYEYACTTIQPLDLSNFKLPELLSVSRTVREEALPVFFAVSAFASTFRGNWCVKNKHWHSAEHLRHHETGIPNMSAFVDLGGRGLALPQAYVRFHNVDFSVTCVCCPKAVEIGTMQLRVIQGNPFATMHGTSTNFETRLAWHCWDQEVKKEVASILRGSQFNGFSPADLRAIARCFRYYPEETTTANGP